MHEKLQIQGLRVRTWRGSILSWRFDLEIISTTILLPSADPRRVFRDVKHQNKQTKVCSNSLYRENADGSLVSYF